MKEKGRAPPVTQSAMRIDRWMIPGNEDDAERIVSGEGGGDFRVLSNGISTRGKIGAKGFENLRHNLQIRRDRGRRRIELSHGG